MKNHNEIENMGRPMQEHVPRINPNIYVPVNAVVQGGDSDTESPEQG